MNQIERIEIGYDRDRLMIINLFCYVFFGLGIFLLFVPDLMSVGLLQIIIVGCLITYNWSLSSDSSPQLIIDRTGICDRRLDLRIISWSYIKDAKIRRHSSKHVHSCSIYIELHEPNPYKQQDWFGSAAIAIDLIDLDVNPEELLDLIHQRMRSRSTK